MDTLFRLVSNLQNSDQQSLNTSSTTRTSTTSSRSSKSYHNQPNHHHHNHNQSYNHHQTYYSIQEEECSNNNFFMDEDDFSSSSSKQQHFFPSTTTTTTPNTSTTSTHENFPYSSHPQQSDPNPYHHHHQSQSQSQNQPFAATSSTTTTTNLDLSTGSKWSSNLLMETARAIADKNSARVQHLMWMLNELSSPYGDIDQKLSSYFLQALFCRMTDSGDRCYRTLRSATEKTCSFDSTRKMVLKFQEVSPWTTFGHVASNGAILEAFEGESKLHIIDISNTFCTQWPTLLEALATRADDTPHLRLTTVLRCTAGTAAVQKVMKEIGARMEKFARLMGVPFKFHVVHHIGDLSELNFGELEIKDDEALAINCVGTLHSVSDIGNKRDLIISAFRTLNPKIVTVVEEEAELEIGEDGFEFLKGFEESLRWFRIYFECLDESFTRTSNERLMLERSAGRALVDLIACPRGESVERRESATRWSNRLRAGGFINVGYSDDVSDDVRALLRRYKEGWTMMMYSPPSDVAGIYLAWKEQPVVWACAWKPC